MTPAARRGVAQLLRAGGDVAGAVEEERLADAEERLASTPDGRQALGRAVFLRSGGLVAEARQVEEDALAAVPLSPSLGPGLSAVAPVAGLEDGLRVNMAKLAALRGVSVALGSATDAQRERLRGLVHARLLVRYPTLGELKAGLAPYLAEARAAHTAPPRLGAWDDTTPPAPPEVELDALARMGLAVAREVMAPP